MNDVYKLSLIICTKNRAAQLKVCLESVSKIQAKIPWQLVIVNNNSSDNTDSIIEAFIKESSIPVRSLMEREPGSSAAKNRGWQATDSEYLAFIDDDCYPAENFIDSVLDTFKENPSAGFIGGQVLLFDKTDLPITIQTWNKPIEFSPRSVIATGVIHGANFAFRRTALIAAKGFDVRFGAGRKYFCEDVDVMAEVLRLGWRGTYNPSVVVFHHHQRKLQTDADKLMRGYDKGRGAFYAKRLLKPNSAKIYINLWLRSLRWQPLGVTLREIIGAFEFWKDNLLNIK
jgi:glycosyltransferase involved in cell wall biosynthesis